MKKLTFHRWLRLVPTLTSAQRHDLEAALEKRDKKALVVEMAALVGVPTCCPHCHHSGIRPWGRASGLPRYRCQGCKRTFGPLTKTPLAGLHHKDRWLLYLEKFSEGESVRKAARRCSINKKAAFLWRHRFLALPSALGARQERGIVEADEAYFLLSFKGQRHLPRRSRKRGGRASKRGLSFEQVPVLTVRDRSGATFDAILPEGRPPGDRSRPETALGPGCRPLHRRWRKGALRTGSSRNGESSPCSQPEQGHLGAGRGLSHPECERIPFAPERVDVSFPWSRNQVLVPLSWMETDD